MEPGEGLEQSLVREIKEELCLDISVRGLFKKISLQEPDFAIDLHAYWCEICGGTLRLSEHVAFMWANLSELKQIDFTQSRPSFDSISGKPSGVSRFLEHKSLNSPVPADILLSEKSMYIINCSFQCL